MFKYQADAQKARELARHYLASIGWNGTPEAYLEILRKLEAEFLSLLQNQGKHT